MDIEYLKRAKKTKKMTLQQIADASGIPKRTVDDIFSGNTKNPRTDTLQAIENALGLTNRFEWTEEEKALGVGRRATYLSEDEWKWLELRSEILRIHGENYLNTLITMLSALTEQK